MFPTPQELLDVLRRPQALHAALVHAPIILAMIGALLCALVLATRGRNATLRTAASACLAIVLVSALAAASAGERTFAEIGDPSIAARQAAATHRWMAERVWMFAVTALAASALAWAKRPGLAQAGRVVAAAASGLLAAWVGLTAHHGGTLVYQHGIGVPHARPPLTNPPAVEQPDDPRVALFESDVRPLLARNCMGCHGPEGYTASGLSLTSPAGFLKGGTRGPAVVPGDPGTSLLLRAVRGDGMPRMPYNQPALSKDEIETLQRWIRDGAVWR